MTLDPLIQTRQVGSLRVHAIQAGGQKLDEHENPGEATLQVLHGQVRLLAGADEQEATTGELLAIPDARHSLEAINDSVILLTVAKTNQP